MDLEVIASSCNGYVGADLEALCREAARLAYRRSSNSSDNTSMLRIRMEDWVSAKSLVGPSMTRGVAKEVSKVSWDDIGGLKDLKVLYNSHLDIILLSIGKIYRKGNLPWSFTFSHTKLLSLFLSRKSYNKQLSGQ